MAKIELTQDLLKELFEYKDGFLYWKVKTSSHSHRSTIGSRAGTLRKRAGGDRYAIVIFRTPYLLSRLIFFYHTGKWSETVDHINHITTDNHIENLRGATRSENSQNKTSRKNSSSKYLGVCFYKRDQNWLATIRIKGKLKSLGYFESETDAALSYNKAANIHFGEFANLNVII